MWEDSSYCWVVICKNYWQHMKQNLFHGHRIPLGVTDAVSSRPTIDQRFLARCDNCGKGYVYKPSEVSATSRSRRNASRHIRYFKKKIRQER